METMKGYYPEGWLLKSVMHWHQESPIAREESELIQAYRKAGYIMDRTHFFPDGTTALAFQLTPLGFRRLRQISPRAADDARKVLDWYQELPK